MIVCSCIEGSLYDKNVNPININADENILRALKALIFRAPPKVSKIMIEYLCIKN